VGAIPSVVTAMAGKVIGAGSGWAKVVASGDITDTPGCCSMEEPSNDEREMRCTALEVTQNQMIAPRSIVR